jgi:hypothetical protein
MTAFIWSKTTAGCALRRLVIDFYADEADAEDVERVRDELHPEFVKDLTLRMIRNKRDENHTNYFSRSVCHEHDEDPRCESRALGLR